MKSNRRWREQNKKAAEKPCLNRAGFLFGWDPEPPLLNLHQTLWLAARGTTQAALNHWLRAALLTWTAGDLNLLQSQRRVQIQRFWLWWSWKLKDSYSFTSSDLNISSPAAALSAASDSRLLLSIKLKSSVRSWIIPVQGRHQATGAVIDTA